MVFDHAMANLSSDGFTNAVQAARRAAHDYTEVLRAHVTGFEQDYLSSTGPRIGIRESRHPPARYELTAQDLRSGRQRSNGVAKATWPIKDHSIPGKPVYHSVGGDGFAVIPLDCLRAKGLDNFFFAERLIGPDAMADAFIRVMGTAFATGDAAGRAASRAT